MSALPSDSSTPSLIVAPISTDDAHAAFVLAKLCKPELAPERWENFLCDWHSDPDGRGILGVRNVRGALLGFASWWRQPDLEHGETVWAGPLYVREMGVRPLVRENLIYGLKEMAGKMNAILKMTDCAGLCDQSRKL